MILLYIKARGQKLLYDYGGYKSNQQSCHPTVQHTNEVQISCLWLSHHHRMFTEEGNHWLPPSLLIHHLTLVWQASRHNTLHVIIALSIHIAHLLQRPTAKN